MEGPGLPGREGADCPHDGARYLFLFDKVVIVCKRRGYTYELKEIIELLSHKMTDDPTNNKDIKKVGPRMECSGNWLV